MASLKRIAEKQLEESLNSLREEREHKHQIKRELDQRLQKDQLQSLRNLVGGLANVSGTFDYADIDDDDVQHETTSGDVEQQEQNDNSLFSEMHANDIKKLEDNIDELNKHKEQLEVELIEFKADLNEIYLNVDNLNKKLLTFGPSCVNYADNNSMVATSLADANMKIGKQALNAIKRTLSEVDNLGKLIVNLNERNSETDAYTNNNYEYIAFTYTKLQSINQDLDQFYNHICTTTGLNNTKNNKKMPTTNSSDEIAQVFSFLVFHFVKWSLQIGDQVVGYIMRMHYYEPNLSNRRLFGVSNGSLTRFGMKR